MPRRGTKVLCRIEPDTVKVFQFTQLNHYPFFWSPDDLARGLLVHVMSDDGSTIGYVWGEWTEVGVLAFHACVQHGLRFPFFSSDLLDQLIRIAFFVGADTVLTAVGLHPHPGPLRRLLLMLGFTEVQGEGDTDLTLNTWNYHGHQKVLRLGQDDQLGHQ